MCFVIFLGLSLRQEEESESFVARVRSRSPTHTPLRRLAHMSIVRVCTFI